MTPQHRAVMIAALRAVVEVDGIRIPDRKVDRTFQQMAEAAARLAVLIGEPRLARDLQNAAMSCHHCGGRKVRL